MYLCVLEKMTTLRACFACEANERDEAGDEDEEEGVLEYDFSDSVEDSEE